MEPAISMSDPIFDQERRECPPTLDYRVEQLVPVVVGAALIRLLTMVCTVIFIF